MRTTNFDVLATAAPLDRQASIVRDGSGDHWEARIPETQLRWLAPPPLKALRALQPSGQLVAAELIGRRFGRLVVLGILLEARAEKKARWVVRCDCGYYEARLAKSLRASDPGRMMCYACDRADQLRITGGRANTGKARAASEQLLDGLARKGVR